MNDVAVVVVNWRSAALTARALADARASAGDLTVQEIVVDNGSGDAELALLAESRPGADVVALPDNRGFAAANNAGIARADARLLLLLNPDAFARGDAVVRLAAHLDAHPDVGVAAPRLVFEGDRRQDSAYRRFPNHWTLLVDFFAPLAHVLARTPWDPHRMPLARLRGQSARIAHATGAALMVRAHAAREAGPLDEGFFLYYEETEWQRRIAARGWAIDFVGGATVVHLGGGSTGAFALASPHYLASVRRYFGASRRSRAIVWLGALASAPLLALAGRLLGSEALRAQARGYRAVLRELSR